MYIKKYVIVFDLDETIGHFNQPYNFWYFLKKFLNVEYIDEKYFHSFLDLFPEFFRTNILKILKFIKKKKISGVCDHVMIYTNNNGPKYWVNFIKSYIHKKLNYELFDQIISAFKINGEIVEKNRTSYNKSHKDFINCTKLPKNTETCFIDDQHHYEMINDNVTYIYVQPYTYNIEYNKLCEKFYNKNTNLFENYNKTKEEFINYFSDKDLKYLNKSRVEKNIDLLISKNIENNIKKFLSKKVKLTKKIKKKSNNLTHKI